MFVLHCILHFGQRSCQFSLENGYLVTLRYCELSVTESPFVCLFLYFAQHFALFWAYAHALKSSFLSWFLLFYSLLYHLLLVGLTHATLPLHSCETCVLNSAAIRCRKRTQPFPDTSVRASYVLFILQILYIMFFFTIFLFVNCDFTSRPHC